MPTWKDAEESVRTAAKSIWGANFQSRLVHGRQIDCYAEVSGKIHIAIEVTEKKDINKIQEDINKLIHVRNVNFQSKFIQTECLCVTSYAPTPAMRNVGAQINIEVISIEELLVRFIPFDSYAKVRRNTPFGSAIDPDTGEKDSNEYINVGLISESGNEIGGRDIISSLSNGRNFILTGEYGTGKSKFIENAFSMLAEMAWEKIKFPLAIDLRKCWGLRDRYEVIRRHLQTLNMSEASESFIKAYNSGLLILLLDGFDEMGVQLWTDDAAALKTLRADALSGVRDIVANQKGGILVCGRDHYFDSNDELISALGLSSKESRLFRTKDEFSDEEMHEFLDKNATIKEVPAWLPRKPLTCEFFSRVMSDLDREVAEDLDVVQFWDLLIDAVCEREAKIHSSFDVDTIKKILVEVAAATRSKLEDVGPLSLTEIQAAFERVVGHAPIDQATVLLQRLPGLGRTAADSEERRFVDTYMLDGLRASDVVFILDRSDVRPTQLVWTNPLRENGLLICGRKITNLNLYDDAIAFCKAHGNSNNRTLLLDIVCSLLVSGREVIDFAGVYISSGYASVVGFSNAAVSNIWIDECVIVRMDVGSANVTGVRVTNTIIAQVDGVSSPDALPKWIENCSVQSVSSIATTSRIRAANLGASQKVLVTILRKTFFQKGSGRKEEALLRGLGRLVKSGVSDKIIGRLISDGLLRREKGDSGNLYVPVRSETRRAGQMLAQLSLSKDPIWLFVSELDDG